MVKLVPIKQVVVEKFTDFPTLGRFVIRDMNRLVAIGVVIDVTKKECGPPPPFKRLEKFNKIKKVKEVKK